MTYEHVGEEAALGLRDRMLEYCTNDVKLTRGTRFMHRLSDLLGRIELPSWLSVQGAPGWIVSVYNDEAKIQLRTVLPCVETGEPMTQLGRVWSLYDTMTNDAIVKTLLMTVRAFVEHEVLEGFKLDGKRIFNPHRQVTQ